ncbi:DUF368 domain-containing protein [Alteribacillus sp. HJP-4]|uniref:DUF368 domain-containing protein n=1 Tax=Alteribacillus sp. HJP-4 TaxID=2775394 RepID=UPI0035CD1BC9
MEWKNILRGMAMGASDIIPGVSGGTVALVLGIYYRLIEAINLLFSRRWKEQIIFFIPLGLGILLAIFSLSNLLEWLLHEYPEPTFAFFLGLILGTIPFLLKEADFSNTFYMKHYLILAAAAAIVISSGVLQGDKEGPVMQSLGTSDFVLLFFSGWLASSAMILPGISGSFVLLIIGVYPTVLSAVSNLNLPVIVVVGSGVVIGILVMSKFLHYLLRNHITGTYSVMTGFLIGSLFVIFPGIADSALIVLYSVITFAGGLAIAIYLGKVDRTS